MTRGRAVGERTVHDVGVSGYPADVSGTPVDVAVMVVEDHLVGEGNEGQVAAGAVHGAFGLSGRTGGVKDEQRICRVHLLGFAVGVNFRHFFMPPFVDLSFQVHLICSPTRFTTMWVFTLRAFCEGLVGVVFLGNRLRAAESSVAGYEHAAVAVVDAVAERFSGETAEYDRVDRADAGSRRECRLPARESSADRR